MSKFEAFMSENVGKIENIKLVVSPRFTGKDGSAAEWELRAITSAEEVQVRKSSTNKAMRNGRTVSSEVDANRYTANLVIKCIVFPDLHDAELQNSYGVMGADELLKVMLTPGEFAALAREVYLINGFTKSSEDMVEDAKN